LVKNQLVESDYQLLLTCIESLHRCRRLEDFPKHSLAELKRLVPCRMACYAELDYGRNRGINMFDPPLPPLPPMEKQMDATHDHPVLNYFKATGDGQALKISDFVAEADYHELDTYKVLFKATGAEDQMGIGVNLKSSFVLGYAFDRGERSFTERERLLLNLIRPHVIQAYSHLEELADCHQLHRDLQTALRENGVGVLILNGARAIIHKTPGVWKRLAAFMPVPDDALSLPDTLARWAFGGDKSDDVLTLGAEPSRLIIRRKRQDKNRLLLLLSEQSSTAAAERLVRYNLTPREQEVLCWIAEGKSNSELATILGVSTATAKTHVERILAKLGVENRTAAASVLRSVGL
jgi:DNA-binding CsgD family transcriptional regulator